MKKALLLPVWLCFFLTACNLPSTSPNPSATPDRDAIATQVATLMAAQPTDTRAPSPTVAPSLTPSQEPTAPATLTPLPTEQPGGSATPAADDPKNGLGDPTWKNTFDTGRGFALDTPYEDENTRIAVENGALVLTGIKAIGWHTWRLTAPRVQNFYLEAAVRTRTCSGDDLYGLVVRAPDFDSGRGYYFGVSCDGRFNFGKWQEQGITTIVSLTNHAAILSGSNQVNRLGIRAEGNKITLYANGKPLQQIEDAAFPETGYFGAWLAASKTAGFTVEYDEMALWALP